MEGSYQPGFYTLNREQQDTRPQPSQQHHPPHPQHQQQHAAHYPLELPIPYHTTAQPPAGFGDQSASRAFPLPHPGPGVPVFRSLYPDSGPMHLRPDILHHSHLQRPPVSYGGNRAKLATPPANYEPPVTTHGAAINRTIQPITDGVLIPENDGPSHSTYKQLPKRNELVKLATQSVDYNHPVTTQVPVGNKHAHSITTQVSAPETLVPSTSPHEPVIDRNNQPIDTRVSLPTVSTTGREQLQERDALPIATQVTGSESNTVSDGTTGGSIQGTTGNAVIVEYNSPSHELNTEADDASPKQDTASSPPRQEHTNESPSHDPESSSSKITEKPSLFAALNLKKIFTSESTPPNITLKVGTEGRKYDGVVAKERIEKGAEFGPLIGSLFDEGRGWPLETTWEIGIKGKVYHYIDGGANWMSNVKCARTEEELNMEAYQYCGDIYFRTIKVVEPGSELRVFYSEDYGKCVGRQSSLKDLKFDKDTKLFQCDECEELFTSAKLIMRHSKCEHTDGKPKEMIPIVTWKKRRKKKVCSKQLPRIKIKIIKVDDGKGEMGLQKDGMFKCTTCNKVFPTSGRLKAHELFHEFSDEEEFPKSTTVRTKRRRAKEFKMFECSVCKRLYKTKRLASRHEGETHGYPCRFCSERFLLKKECSNHERTHQAFKSSPTAGNTGVSFRRVDESAKIQPSDPAEDDFKDMLGSHTSDNQKLYKCRFCPKRYSSRGSAERHEMEIHTLEGNFKCRYCPKVFGKESRLKEHLLVHKHVNMYCCAICPRSFASESALNNHQGEHTGLKPFKCEVCGRGFRTRKFAQKHKRRIHEECPNRFFCSVCNKGFTSRSNLKVHERRHKGIRPYVCLECGRGFSACNSLAAHKQAMHVKEKNFSCQICGQSFALNHHFNRHMAKHRLQEDPDIMNSIHIQH